MYILDGAMGTAIEKYDIDKSGYGSYRYCNEMQNILKPEVVKDVHRRYIEAGARIIETNTFNCNLLTLTSNLEADTEVVENEVYNLCLKGCKLAREVANEFREDVKIAGSIGPTFFSLTTEMKKEGADFNKEKEILRKIYRKQLEAVIDSDVDFLLFETVFDKLNLVVALELSLEIMKDKNKEIPILVAMAVGENGKIYSGETIEEIVREIDSDKIVGYGFNCCNMGEYLFEELRKLGRLEKVKDKLRICYPNAGYPDKNGKYPIIPKELENFYRTLIEENLADIIGGCCGLEFSEIHIIKELS